MFATRNNCQRFDWLSDDDDCSSEVPGRSMVYVVVVGVLLDESVAFAFVVVNVVDSSPVASGDDEYFSRAINFNRLIASNACRFSYKSLFWIRD